jgi:hypothetical protein
MYRSGSSCNRSSDDVGGYFNDVTEIIEREALGTHGETELEHASGLGLWLVTWGASLSAGEITFAENDPRSSVVTLSLPAVDGCPPGSG